jgi:DNA-binding response OmpR family regulator
VGDGRQALERIRANPPALVVLDVMLPGLDGFEVCRRLRAEGNPVPVIMLTARDDDVDKIVGLEIGADDYLTKPFNPRELVARVKAILRRMERSAASTQDVLTLGDLRIDPAAREVFVAGQPVTLRTKEFDLLYTLAQHRGQVLTREQILEKAWGFSYFGQTRTVDVHVAQLRKKLANSRARIETVTGVGYKLVV